MRAFEEVAESICRTILVRRFGAEAVAEAVPVCRFVLEQHARMPDYLRWAMVLATLTFDWWGLCSAGACFSHLSARRRQAQIEAWRTAPAAPARDFVRFYDSLVVFCRHSRHGPDSDAD